MEAVITGIVVCSAPLVLLGLVSPWRWRLVGAVLVALAGVGTGAAFGVLTLSDLWVVPAGVGMNTSLILMGLWCVFGAVARTAGPLSIPGPPWLVAMVMGATLGEVPAAAILSVGARSPKGAARLALSAAGGGMIGRLGDPAMVILGEGHPMVLAVLLPLGVMCAYVVRPRSEDLVSPEGGNTARTRLVVAVALVALVPGAAMWAVLAGILGLAVLAGDRRGHVDLVSPTWNIIAMLLALLAIVAGLSEQIATGLEKVGEVADWMGPPALTLIAALCTAISDGTALALLADGTLDRAVSLDAPDLRIALAAGISVGGLGPLIAAGSIRAGLRLWILQVVLAVAWLGVWACI